MILCMILCNKETKTTAPELRVGSDNMVAVDALAQSPEERNGWRFHLRVAPITDTTVERKLLQGLQDRLPRNLTLTAWNPNKICLPGTRGKILNEVRAWITSSDSPQRILWIRGQAGTGKSTLSHSIAMEYSDLEQLGGHFFFSRDIAEQRDPSSVFISVAIQLASVENVFRKAICQTLARDPAVARASLLLQFRHLVLAPLNAATTPQRQKPLVFVFDALDECEGAANRDDFFSVLAKEAVKLPNFARLVMTSRPERHLKEFEGNKGVKELLLDISDESVRQDITKLIQVKTAVVKRSPSLLPDWPGITVTDQSKLAERASGLFIWAATACEMLKHAVDPRNELRRLLVDEQPKHMSEIDKLYTTVLAGSPWDDLDFCGAYGVVMGTVLVAKSPLSTRAIDAILGNDTGGTSSRQILSCLRSVVRYAHEEPVRILHPSFADFLTNPKRCSNTLYAIVPREHNCMMASRCLRIMRSSLTRNICSLDDSHSPLNSKIDDLASRVASCISEDVQYCCRFWVDHVVSSEEQYEHVYEFLQDHFIHWLEVMSLLGQTYDAVSSMQKLEKWTKVVYIRSSIENEANCVSFRHFRRLSGLSWCRTCVNLGRHFRM